MNAQSGSGPQRQTKLECRRVAVVVIGACCLWTTGVRAQSETPPSAPVAVETFYGLKKVQAVRPAHTNKQVTTRPQPVLPAKDAPCVETHRVFPGPVSPEAIVPTTNPPPAIVRAFHETMSPDSTRDEDRRLPPRTEVPNLEPVPDHEPMPAQPAIEPKPTEAASNSQPTTLPESISANTSEPRETFITLTSKQAAMMFGAFVVSMTALLLSSVYALRRFGRKNRLRVELVLPPGWSSHPAGAAVSPPHGRNWSQDANETPLAKNFELGPTFEEERELQAAEEARREAALLQHICDQNVRLQDEVACQGTGDGTQTVEQREPVAVSTVK